MHHRVVIGLAVVSVIAGSALSVWLRKTRVWHGNHVIQQTSTESVVERPLLRSGKEQPVTSRFQTDERDGSANSSGNSTEPSGVRAGLRKRDWDPGFLAGLGELYRGKKIDFELVDGERASGTIDHWEYSGTELIHVSGQLARPQRGRFFFQKQTMDGVAGSYFGVVEFRGSYKGYRIEPTAEGGAELVERPLGALVCLQFPNPAEAPAKAIAEIPPLNPGDFPEVPIPEYQDGVPVLQSLPGARAVIYLDFGGGYTPAYGGISYARPNLGNAQIREVWKRVAEDFMPFAINVTTDLKVFTDAPANSRQRAIITPTDTVDPGAGGAAYIGSFNSTMDIPCWAFITSTAAYCAQACTHEIGHTLGLTHSGSYVDGKQQEYYYGHGNGETSWAPIMGVGYYRNVTQWSRGEYANANNPVDQLAVIAAQNNITWRQGLNDTAANAPYLEIYDDFTVRDEGVIRPTGQPESFQFSTHGGAVFFRADPVSMGPNLALEASLCDSSGVVLAHSNPQSTLWAALGADLPPGTYTLHLAGAGRNDPRTNGFSAYGSLGYFSITGMVDNAVLPLRYAIPENIPNGTVVGVLSQNTSAGLHQFRIASGNPSGAFALDNTGVLSVANNAPLDYEALGSNTQHAVQIELFVDILNLGYPDLNEFNRRIVVTVTNVNEAPKVGRFVINNNGFGGVSFLGPEFRTTILDQSPAGTIIGTLEASDPDFYTLLSYSILSGNEDEMFHIDQHSGRITLAGSPKAAIQNTYNLVVVVSDQTPPNSLMATSSVSITVELPYQRGSIACATYPDTPGPLVSTLINDPRFPNDPSSEEWLASFESTKTGQRDFGEVLRGYLLPPVTGNYTFWIASRNNSELWLSGTTNPADMSLVAGVEGESQWTEPREWTKYSSQQSAPVFLRSGHAYYIEARLKAAGPTNHLAVAWECPEAGILRQVIPAQHLAPFRMNYVPHPLGFETYLRRNAITGAYVGKLGVSDVNNQPSSFSEIFSPNGPLIILGGSSIFPGGSWFLTGGSWIFTGGSRSSNDPADTATFSIVSGNEDELFTVDPATGVMRLANDQLLQAATRTNYVLEVQATDNGAPPLSGRTNVSITIVPEAAINVAALAAEVWTNVAGSDIAALTSLDRFPCRPDLVWPLDMYDSGMSVIGNFSANTGTVWQPWGQDDSPTEVPGTNGLAQSLLTYRGALGSRIRALLTPPQTGLYTFFISSADGSRLLLSFSTNAGEAKPIAFIEGGATEYCEWDRYRSQQSGEKWLEAGKLYYIETLHKAGGALPIPGLPVFSGVGHVEVGWTGPSLTGTNIIAGSFLRAIDIGCAPTFTNVVIKLSITSQNRTVVTNLLAADSPQEHVAYRIVSGNISNTFALNPWSGELSVADNTAFASYAVTNFLLVVEAQDSGYGGLYPLKSSFAEVAILVVDDAPAVNWLGNGINNRWSTASNWDGPLPHDHSKLSFTGANWLTNYNDLLTAAGHVSISGAGFRFDGNPLLLRGGLSHSGYDTNVWTIDSTLGASQTFSISSGTFVLASHLNNAGFPLTFSIRSTARLEGVVSGSGDLIKTGSGRLVVSAANPYSGATHISQGKFVLEGEGALTGSPIIQVDQEGILDVSNASNPIVPEGQTLAAIGTIVGPIDVYGTLACTSTVFSASASIPLLTVSNRLHLAGTTILALRPTSTALPLGTSVQRILVRGPLVAGGNLTVTMDPPQNVRAGSTFRLFEAKEYAGRFAGVNLPAGVQWDTRRLMVDGTITAGQAVVFPTPIALLPLIVTNGTAVLRFTTVRNRLYSVEMTPTLTPPVRWTQYQALNGTGEAMSIKVPAPTNAPGRFFRVRVF